jgi:hypothetical protein
MRGLTRDEIKAPFWTEKRCTVWQHLITETDRAMALSSHSMAEDAMAAHSRFLLPPRSSLVVAASAVGREPPYAMRVCRAQHGSCRLRGDARPTTRAGAVGNRDPRW